MTDKPPTKARVVLVDRGADENCRIVISKRDDYSDDNACALPQNYSSRILAPIQKGISILPWIECGGDAERSSKDIFAEGLVTTKTRRQLPFNRPSRRVDTMAATDA